MKIPKTTIRPLTAAMALGLALIAPSCVVVTHTGQALRDATTVRTGVDTYHPVDGKLYYAKVDGKEHLYMLAREVTYTARHVAGEIYEPSNMVGPRRQSPAGGLIAANVKPTGRQLWVEVSLEEFDAAFAESPREIRVTGRERLSPSVRSSFVRVVDGLPKGAKVFLDGETFDDQPAPAAFFGNFSERRRSGAGVMTALSYPLSYVVDPFCTGIPTAVTYTTGVVGGAVIMPVASIVIEAMQGSGGTADMEPEPLITCEARGTSFQFRSGDSRPGCAPMLAESLDKSRIYTLYAQGLSNEQACAAAKKLYDAGIKVNIAYFGDCSKKEVVYLEI